jgi:hypothetical protein
MSYRTKRQPTRSLLAFGVGATLAIMQLGAGCVPASTPIPCASDATDEGGRCITPAGDAANEGGDAK